MPSFHLIPFYQIEIPLDRQRKEFLEEPIAQLAMDIMAPHGLLHPLILRNDKTTLICGERRYRAIDRLYAEGKTITCHGESVPLGMVPCVFLGDLSSTALARAEFSENTARLNLSWSELCAAQAAIAEVIKQDNPEATNRDIAAAMLPAGAPASAVHSLATDLPKKMELAKNLHLPEVAKASTMKEADTVLKRHKELEHAKKVHQTLKAAAIKTPHSFHFGDFRELSLGDAPFDCMIADPPYGVDAQTFKSGSAPGGAHHYNDTWSYAADIYLAIAKSLPTWLKPEAHAYIFLDIRRTAAVLDLLDRALAGQDDFHIWPRPLIWYKGSTGIAPDPRYTPRNSYDAIIYIRRGERQVLQVFDDVIVNCTQPTGLQSSGKLIMAEKPVALYRNLLGRVCRPGNTVLDPTCGSGTIFKAADAMKLFATGVDRDEVCSGLCQGYLNGNPATPLAP